MVYNNEHLLLSMNLGLAGWFCWSGLGSLMHLQPAGESDEGSLVKDISSWGDGSLLHMAFHSPASLASHGKDKVHRMKAHKPSWGLGSEVTHCNLHHMLLAKASYKASPVLSTGGGYHIWREDLQSHIAKAVDRGRSLLGVNNTIYHSTHVIINCKAKVTGEKCFPQVK